MMHARRAGMNDSNGADRDGWERLIKRVEKKRRRVVYRITLRVRGREVVKEYDSEDEYRKWKAAFEQQIRQKQVSGVTEMYTSLVYR
jgi:hypothetical protein